MTSKTLELARQEGIEFRSVRLTLAEDGEISLDGQDIGPAVKEIWNDGDYEFWVRVAAPSVPKLVFELLREKFMRNLGAVSQFRDWCKAHDIEHEFGNYA